MYHLCLLKKESKLNCLPLTFAFTGRAVGKFFVLFCCGFYALDGFTAYSISSRTSGLFFFYFVSPFYKLYSYIRHYRKENDLWLSNYYLLYLCTSRGVYGLFYSYPHSFFSPTLKNSQQNTQLPWPSLSKLQFWARSRYLASWWLWFLKEESRI